MVAADSRGGPWAVFPPPPRQSPASVFGKQLKRWTRGTALAWDGVCGGILAHRPWLGEEGLTLILSCNQSPSLATGTRSAALSRAGLCDTSCVPLCSPVPSAITSLVPLKTEAFMARGRAGNSAPVINGFSSWGWKVFCEAEILKLPRIIH